MCINTTVRAGYDLGYNIEVISNGCATKDLVFNGEIISAETIHKSFFECNGWDFL